MDFITYMNTLPNVKVEEIKKISELTSTSIQTVYRWIAGDIEPPLIKKKIIADYLQRKIEDLFPE